MLKSHLSKTDNPSAVVTRQDVGSFVQVQGVGKGILRYVGPIHGKDGMFCGIELDNDGGKHNGTYMNVSYFSCPPKRGIFAPLYKVELDELDDVPMMTTSQQVSSHQRMIRSALPSLPLRISTTPRTDDIMQASIYSDISMNMDGSMLSTASWGDDLMMTSNFTNTTYNIPSNKSYFNDTEEFDLMSVQAPKSVIQIDREALRREEERLSGLGTSVVLENSRIGVENLPIVEDDEDDLETPLVEHVPQSDFFKPLHCSTLLETNESHDSFQDGNEAFVRPPSRQSVDTGYNGESDTSKLSSIHDDSNEDHNRNNKNVPAVVLKSKKSTSPSLHRKVSPLPKMKIKEEKPKKVKEVAPSAPKFPVKPKAPSKHQMMMEQLKASIEAEKNKPKKEIKPRVSLLPPPVKAKENEDPSTMAVNPSEAPKKAKPVISKISSIAPPSKPVIERPKKERQPLYVPPPPKEKKEKEVAKPSTAPSTVPSVSKPVDAPPPSTAPSESSAPSTKTIVKPKPQFPTSSFAGSNAKSAASPARTSKSKTSEPTPGPSKPIPKKEIADSEKLARLQRAVQTSDALSIALNQREFKRAELEVKLVETLDRLAEKSKQVEELRSRLTVADQRYQEEVERSKAHGEQVTRAHSETVERLKSRHEQQLEEKSKEHERALDDEKSRHEAEVEAMSRRHQKVVAALDEKIAEAEKIAEQLKIDKKSLQTALSNDSDQRNQMLTKEINSLQTALEFKSSEMKELRQKHQQVALRVEEIPVKELEITKLKHKVTELKQALDQKMNYEKLLVHQNEELKRHQMAVEEEKDSMQRSMDVMRYKYENGETIDEETFTPSKFFTPSGKVQFRSRSSNSEHRPNSGIQVPTATNTSSRLSQSSYSDIMDRSYDRDSLTRSSISMFTSQVRLPENHADDVIYAPDEIILTSSCKKRLSFAEEEDNEQVNGNSTNAQTDSGIGAI